MKTSIHLKMLCVLSIAISSAFADTPKNPHVDIQTFLKDAHAVEIQRVNRVIDQDAFLKMTNEKGTIILDARSADKFAMLHVVGAVNLPFTDFTEESLAKIFPDKDTRILIYCNNNFNNAPRAMPLKSAGASLNISTLISLQTYGYKNVYELGGYIDAKNSKLPFAGSDATK
ncbi:MAG: rhodanese-like domain-containing protein [Akkermansiaceae bacterium]|jgi:phage shock protein E|nr:rhodanese-like domain-containing protein [Luteolibacter sp.]